MHWAATQDSPTVTTAVARLFRSASRRATRAISNATATTRLVSGSNLESSKNCVMGTPWPGYQHWPHFDYTGLRSFIYPVADQGRPKLPCGVALLISQLVKKERRKAK